MAGRQTVAGFALLGAITGSLATVSLFTVPSSMKYSVFPWLELSPLSLAPGLVFGIVFGVLLAWRGAAGPGHALGYAAASTLSYLAAETFAVEFGDSLPAIWLLGIVAGLLGGALLTGATALLMPLARRLRPGALMLAAAGLLGALLEIPLAQDGGFWGFLLFFAVWQAGYAAAFATALPAAGGVER